jgi:hypothetical protein
MKNMEWQSYNTGNIKGKYLFRFLSEERLKQFLNTGDLWFSRSDKFGDKMECVRLRDLIAHPKPNFNAIKNRKQKHLICCFHESTKESLALWDTHFTKIHERRKYALMFERNQLVHLVKKSDLPIQSSITPIGLTHGKVRYKTLIGNSQKELLKKTIKYVAFRKESAFAYEREYRFVILLKDKCSDEGIAYNIGLPNNMPFKILVNPLLKKEEYSQSIKKLDELKITHKFQESTLAKWLKPDLW